MSHLNGTDLDDPLDVDAINARLAELRQYRTANVPPPQLDAPTVTGHGVSVGQPPGRWTTTPPTVPGWWWVWDGYEVCAIQFYKDGTHLVTWITADNSEPVERTGTHWQQIESVPASPFVRVADTDETEHGIAPGDPLIVPCNSRPDAVAAALKRMFSAAWWQEFQKAVGE